MKIDWKSRWREIEEDKKKLLSVLLIPLVVLILILVIVLVDRSANKKEPQETTVVQTTEAETMAASTGESDIEPGDENFGKETEEETTEPAETETEDAFASENFQRDSIPEIKTLMESYFKARSSADPAAMNALYGKGELSETELQTEKTRMWNNSKYVTGFENIATYVKSGKTSDSWLVYATADIKFRSVKTAAPMIMWCYVTKNSEGAYLLSDTATLPADVLQYADEANRSEEVRRLAADINGRLKTALTEDADLNSVYGILNEASPVWEDDSRETQAEVKILDESQEAASLEAASESESAAAEAAGTENAAAGADSAAAGADSAAAGTDNTAAGTNSAAAGAEAAGTTAGTTAAGAGTTAAAAADTPAGITAQ